MSLAPHASGLCFLLLQGSGVNKKGRLTWAPCPPPHLLAGIWHPTGPPFLPGYSSASSAPEGFCHVRVWGGLVAFGKSELDLCSPHGGGFVDKSKLSEVAGRLSLLFIARCNFLFASKAIFAKETKKKKSNIYNHSVCSLGEENKDQSEPFRGHRLILLFSHRAFLRQCNPPAAGRLICLLSRPLQSRKTKAQKLVFLERSAPGSQPPHHSTRKHSAF